MIQKIKRQEIGLLNRLNSIIKYLNMLNLEKKCKMVNL